MRISGFLCLMLTLEMFTVSMAQQSPLSSLAYKDKYRMIPAYAGLEGTLAGSAIYRNQWQNLPGHPQGIDLAVHCPVYKWGSALGVLIGQDELGLERHNYIRPSFNKVIKWNEVLLTPGIDLEMDWLSFRSELARTPDGNYPGNGLDHNDPELLNQGGTRSIFDFGVSVFASWHRLQAGLAVEKLLESGSKGPPLPWKNRRSIKFLISNDFEWNSATIFTQLLAYSDLIKLQTDFFCGFDYTGNIFGGIHLRGYNANSLESLGLSVGFNLSKNIQLAYCHEFYIGKIPVSYVSSSQELGLFYNFGKAFGLGKPARIIHSPRYSD